MSPLPFPDAERRNALLTIRIIWFAFIVGQLGFGAVAIFIVSTKGGAGQSQLQWQMLAIATGTLIGAIGLGYFLRNQLYKKNWIEHAVTASGFFQGNLILLVLLEATTIITLLFVMASSQVFPMILPGVMSLAVQCANFPNGSPMDPTMPNFLRDPK